MTVTEHLMRPGTFSVGLRSTAPALTVRKILNTIDGAGGHIVITPGRLPEGIADATILGLALYTGRIEARPSRGTIEGKGVAAWLGNDDGTTVIETAITKSAASLTTWITDLLVNGITVGTITNTSTYSGTFLYVTYREAIDQVCLATGAEYEIKPNFTISAAAPATLFGAPTVVVTRKPEGVDGQYRGIEGGLLDQAVTANRQARKILVVGQAGALGSATNAGLLLKDKAGNAPSLTRLVDAASEPAANLAGLAQATLNLSGVRREFNVSSTSPGVRNYVRPGSYVYVYDVDSGITDTANQIVFRGEVISPLKVRVLSLSWPIERGMGVYLRSNAATPQYTDLSDYVEFDQGDAFWTVGSERINESTGSVARLGDGPAVEARTAVGAGEVAYARKTSNQSSISAIATVLSDLPATMTTGRRYLFTVDLMLESTVPTDRFDIYLYNIENNLYYKRWLWSPGGTYSPLTLTWVNEVSFVGVYTWRVDMSRVSGSGTVTVFGAASTPSATAASAPVFSSFLIEDIGPL